MSRLGGGMFGKSGGANGAGTGNIRDFIKKNPDFMKMDATTRNEKLMEFKMEEKMRQMMNHKFSYDMGNSKVAEKEMSESAKKLVEKMIAAQIKSRQKKVTVIRPTWFNGGGIKKNGDIVDAAGKKVGSIDPDTLKIKIGNYGYGTYKDTPMTVTMIQRKVQALQKPASGGHGGGGFGGGVGNFWGGSSGHGGSNDAWFFGGGNKDGNGWW